MGIARDIRNIKRVSHIANVLFREGLGYFLEEWNLKHHLPVVSRMMNHRFREPEKPEVRFRKAMERLGGPYIKLGQLLSIRPDLIPQSYCDEFSKLQDDVNPFPFKQVKEVVESELRKPIDEIFPEFDKKPLGSASIGQVHLAKLKSGKKVVVKVQRPKIREMMHSDIDIMYYIAGQIEKRMEGSKNYSPLEIVTEFERYTEKELDYREEAKNAERLYQNLHDSKSVIIPRVYIDYTTGKVLTLEYIEGKKLTDLLKSKKRFNRERTARLCVDAILKMVFEDGFFHADLHPGNILVVKDRIALLDFGITGRLSESLKEKGLDLFIYIVEKDIDSMTRALLRIGKPLEGMDIDKFRDDVESILEEYHGLKLKYVRVTHILHLILNSCIRHNIKMPVNLILVGKAMVTVEGTCRKLNPDFDFVSHSRPYINNVLQKRRSPKKIAGELISASSRIKEVIYDLPRQTSDIVDAIKKGTVKIDIEDTDIRKLSLEIDRSSNRVAYGIVIGALIVAGALIAQTGKGPFLMGYPALATSLFLIAIATSLFLMISIIKEGR